mmetsp:Transcript_85102/g.255069  ORF Transcript_85102/g.255069 Transcript_85102/m.255069 type:complete len:293 (-) Transcript_85102:1024-1902(-)
MHLTLRPLSLSAVKLPTVWPAWQQGTPRCCNLARISQRQNPGEGSVGERGELILGDLAVAVGVELLDHLLEEGEVAVVVVHVRLQLGLGHVAVAVLVHGGDHLLDARLELVAGDGAVAVRIELQEADESPPLVFDHHLQHEVLDRPARLQIGYLDVLLDVGHERLDDVEAGEQVVVDGDRVDLLGVEGRAAHGQDFVGVGADDDLVVKVKEVGGGLGRAARVPARLGDDRSLERDQRLRPLEGKLAEEVAHQESARRVLLLVADEAALDHGEVDVVLLESSPHVTEQKRGHA